MSKDLTPHPIPQPQPLLDWANRHTEFWPHEVMGQKIDVYHELEQPIMYLIGLTVTPDFPVKHSSQFKLVQGQKITRYAPQIAYNIQRNKESTTYYLLPKSSSSHIIKSLKNTENEYITGFKVVVWLWDGIFPTPVTQNLDHYTRVLQIIENAISEAKQSIKEVEDNYHKYKHGKLSQTHTYRLSKVRSALDWCRYYNLPASEECLETYKHLYRTLSNKFDWKYSKNVADRYIAEKIIELPNRLKWQHDKEYVRSLKLRNTLTQALLDAKSSLHMAVLSEKDDKKLKELAHKTGRTEEEQQWFEEHEYYDRTAAFWSYNSERKILKKTYMNRREEKKHAEWFIKNEDNLMMEINNYVAKQEVLAKKRVKEKIALLQNRKPLYFTEYPTVTTPTNPNQPYLYCSVLEVRPNQRKPMLERNASLLGREAQGDKKRKVYKLSKTVFPRWKHLLDKSDYVKDYRFCDPIPALEAE